MECFLRIHFDICKKSVGRKELFQISKVYKVSLCNSITIKSLSISVKSLTIINLKTGAEAVKKLYSQAAVYLTRSKERTRVNSPQVVEVVEAEAEMDGW